tara:strand:- start:769 stop:1782 length:1014 start_codon:yes stop_codon:yes gene_type:complete
MLYIKKRGQIWHIEGTVTYAGQKKTVRKTTGHTLRREAEEECRAIEQRVINEMKGGDNLTPFNEVADDWFETTKQGATCEVNTRRLKLEWGKIPISKLDTAAWNKFVKRKLKGATPSHVNRIRTTLVSILNHAAVTYNIPKKKEGEHRIRYLTVEEQEHLFSCYPDFIRAYFIMISYQGFRRTEAMRLTLPGINMEMDTLQLKVKGGKWLTVPMHSRVKEALQEHLKLRADDIKRSNSGQIFLTRNTYYKDGSIREHAHPYASSDSLYRIHVKACKKAGIPDFTVHDWRHHFASHLMQSGADLKSLMKLGGWNSESMVFRYADLPDAHTRHTMEKRK